MNLPKILTQNCPKYEIAQNFARNFDTLHQPGRPVPPGPPTSYAYDGGRVEMLTNKIVYFVS